MNRQERIEVNPLVCHGKRGIKGTQVMASVILDNLAAGESAAAILHSYPSLQPADIPAASACAAADTKHRKTGMGNPGFGGGMH